MPAFMIGASVTRGAALPVVSVERLLDGVAGQQASIVPGRVVVVRAGARTVGLAVDDVIGVRMLSAQMAAQLPPLLRDASREAVAAIGTLDGDFLLVLQAAQIVSEEVFAAADAAVAS